MIKTTVETVEAIKAVITQQPDRPSNVRIFMAGSGCSGPSFGIALDDQSEGDLADASNGINFIMAKELFEQYGEIKVEFMDNGYYVAPVNQGEASCGSCSGCGGH